MRARHVSIIVHSVLAFLCLLALIGNFMLVYGVDAFGSPFLFGGALVAEIFLLVLLCYSLLVALDTPLYIAGTILTSALKGAATNLYVQRLMRTHSPVLCWVFARLRARRASGLFLSIVTLLAVIAAGSFIRILSSVLTRGPLTQTDQRIAHLMPLVRTPLQSDFFRMVTFTASWQLTSVVVALLVLLFWARRQRVAGAVLIGMAVVTQLIAASVKTMIHRSRPPLPLHQVAATGASFPSGHTVTATVYLGVFVYMMWRSYRRPLARLFVLLIYIVWVGLVGISRIYFDVHFASDVLGGFFLGLTLLIIYVGGLELFRRTQRDIPINQFAHPRIWLVGPFMIALSLIASPLFVPFTHVVTQAHHSATLGRVDVTTIRQLPLESFTLTGKQAEPVDFIYEGSKTQIEALFRAHGWYEVARSTLANTLQAFSVGFQGRQYLNAPVTPFYVSDLPEDLAFEKPTQANTLRQRHHTRLWQTDFTLPNGTPLWVATASYDEGIEFAGTLRLPTHHIAPDLSAERSYILNSLQVRNATYVPASLPEAGQNVSGDIFFTDGNVAVVAL